MSIVGHCANGELVIVRNKMEMAIANYLAQKYGKPIQYWYGTNKTGRKTLKTSGTVLNKDFEHIELSKCNACNGAGKFQPDPNDTATTIVCNVCRASGMTKKGDQK